MSLKRMPSVGKSLMSRILALSSDRSMSTLPLSGPAADDSAARLGVTRGLIISPDATRRNRTDAGARRPGPEPSGGGHGGAT